MFEPRSVAVVGASTDERKRGFQAVRALQDAGYHGRILPVNPKGGEVLGLPVAAGLGELPEVPDLALVCTPAASVPGVLEECVDVGVGAAVVLALGFREAGTTGELLENRLREVVTESGLHVVGPNTSGLLVPRLGLDLIGVGGIRPGNVALLVQSGNMGLAVMTEAMRRSQEGFSAVVGVGNEAGITFHEYLDYFGQDAHTRAICMYVEGFRYGTRFLEAARRVSRTKPIVLLKGGRSLRGRAAARSHTGAVAGSYPVFRAGMKGAGVVQVRRSDDLFPVAMTLANQPGFNGSRGVAVLTDGGGHGTLAVDALRTYGSPLAELQAATTERLTEVMGTSRAPENPIDLAGAADADPMAFAHALGPLLHDDQVGGVLVVGLFGGYARRFSAALADAEVQAAREMVASARASGKPLVVHSLFADEAAPALDVLREKGVPVIGSLEVASRCIAACSEVGSYQARRARDPRASKQAWKGWKGIDANERKGLLETEARELVRAYGVNVVHASFCRTAEEAAAAQQKLGAPAVFKVVSSSITHKSDAGGVVLGVDSEAGAREAFNRIRSSALAYTAARGIEPDFRGVLVSPMLPQPVAEVIVGYKRDPHYGGVLIVGLGGIAVEVLQDITLRLLPITREDVEEMLSEIKAAKLLSGHRGRPPVDRQALIHLMLGIADCVRANPEIVELEVNPVFAYEYGAVAADVRAIL